MQNELKKTFEKYQKYKWDVKTHKNALKLFLNNMGQSLIPENTFERNTIVNDIFKANSGLIRKRINEIKKSETQKGKKMISNLKNTNYELGELNKNMIFNNNEQTMLEQWYKSISLAFVLKCIEQPTIFIEFDQKKLIDEAEKHFNNSIEEIKQQIAQKVKK